jgi:hypothetical protein
MGGQLGIVLVSVRRFLPQAGRFIGPVAWARETDGKQWLTGEWIVEETGWK